MKAIQLLMMNKKISGPVPRDWHVPTDAEFTILTTYLGGGAVAGDKLKASSTDSVPWNGTNSSGFTALPSGVRFGGGFGSYFDYLGNRTYFWSSSEGGPGDSWCRFLRSDYAGVNRADIDQALGFSVRCLRSVSPSESSDADGTIYTDDYTGNDGTKYDSVKIGNQIWINENLKETKYYDGTTIPRLTDSNDWRYDTTGARCEYNNNSSIANTYGYLYNWHAVNNAKGLINEDSQ